ncbi:MAG: helix-turn-helix domain-containing protein [Dehalococcoidia bacterium]
MRISINAAADDPSAGRQHSADGTTQVNRSPFDDYLDLVEAARELGIHPQSLRRLIKQKRVPAMMFAGKYLIERDKLEMFKANYDPRPGRKPIRRLL